MLQVWADAAGFEVGLLDADYSYTFDWSDRHMIASGPSPRHEGSTHSVVWYGGRDGRVVHDPHPSRDGLAGDPIDWLYIGADPPWET